MAHTLEKTKGRKSGKRFYQIYDDVIAHPNWYKLYDRSQRLFVDLLSQYNGSNNGDLCATMKFMKARGWSSASKLDLALKELRYYGFVRVARQGGLNKPTLLALTCFPINECKGKLDINATHVAPNDYKATKKKWKPPKPKPKLEGNNRHSKCEVTVLQIGSSQH